jgi:hypothetical protein
MLLVQDRRKAPSGRGEPITAGDLDPLATRLGDNVQTNGPTPPWSKDRFFVLCWDGTDDEWLLVEDEETTERSRQDAAIAQDARK